MSNDFFWLSFCILYRWNFGLCYFCTFDFNFNKSSAGSFALYVGAEHSAISIIVSMVLANLRPCSSMSVAMIILSGLLFSMRDFREWCGLPAVVMILMISSFLPFIFNNVAKAQASMAPSTM